MKLSHVLVIAALTLGACGSAGATTLTMNLATDNLFSLYISTDDGVIGDLVGTGSDWRTTSQFTSDLTAGTTYFIHIVGQNLGNYTSSNPAALIGSFSLSDTSYQFANGSSALDTNTTDWAALNSSDGSWATPIGSPQSLGVNGGPNIWTNNKPGAEDNISLAANWIWSSTASSPFALFSTEITSRSAVVSTTPLPSTWTMLLLGLVGFGIFGSLRRATSCRFVSV